MCIGTMSLMSSQQLNTFAMRLIKILVNKCGVFWIAYDDQCRYVNIWKIYITLNSANQYFSNDQSMKSQN